jgi:hypothetical protein
MACFVAEFSCCVPRCNMIIFLLSLLIRVYGTLFPSQCDCRPKLLNSTWGYTGIPVHRLVFLFFFLYPSYGRGTPEIVRLSYTAKLKREVIRCAEDKGNRKAAANFGVDESNIRLWRKHKAAISGCEASREKFTGPKKGRHVHRLYNFSKIQLWIANLIRTRI